MLQSIETEKLSIKEGSSIVGGMNLIVKEKILHITETNYLKVGFGTKKKGPNNKTANGHLKNIQREPS